MVAAMRFAGIKQNKICIVSNSSFACPDYDVVPIPAELDQIHSEDLIAHYRVKDGVFVSKKERKPAKELKVALVCNLGECGISTYSKFLFNELTPLLGDYKLFVEYNDHLNLEGANFPADKIVQCWKRGESLIPLTKQLREYDPDVILIQHEWGIFPNAAYFIAMLTQLSEYRVITIMHSIFRDHFDKLIVLGAIQEMVVHLKDAKEDLLEKKKLRAKIHMIPHGSYPYSEKRLWPFYKTPHTILQQGFGFSYKNFAETIRACALLKDKYPDLFLTLLISENENNLLGHQLHFQELLALIDKLEMQESVGIIRGFQSEQVVDAYLRTNRIAVYPYKLEPNHMVWGASGSARQSFSANIPTITSSIPHFSDLPSIKADTDEDIAKEIDRLFSDEQAYKEQLTKQKEYVLANSWKITADRYVAMLEEPVK
jgi:hypothetical protein